MFTTKRRNEEFAKWWNRWKTRIQRNRVKQYEVVQTKKIQSVKPTREGCHDSFENKSGGEPSTSAA